jgi:hypothetical protein
MFDTHKAYFINIFYPNIQCVNDPENNELSHKGQLAKTKKVSVTLILFGIMLFIFG